MKESVYKTYEELPLFLNAKMVAQVLGIAPSSAYELIITRDGRKHNGTLRYTILPIQNAVDLYNQRQLWRLEETVEQMRVSKELEGNEEHPA